MPPIENVIQSYHHVTHWFMPVFLHRNKVGLRNAQNTVFLGLLAGVSVPIFAMLYHHLDFDLAAAVVLSGGATMICTPLVLKATGRVAVAREYFVLCFYVMKLFLAYYLGGIAAPTLPWLLLCPMIALALGSVRSCAQWGAIVALTVTGMFYVQTRGIVVFPAVPAFDQCWCAASPASESSRSLMKRRAIRKFEIGSRCKPSWTSFCSRSWPHGRSVFPTSFIKKCSAFAVGSGAE